MRHEAYLDNGGFGGSNRGASICADQDSSVTPLFKRAASRPGQGLRYAAIAHARSGPVSKSQGGETAKRVPNHSPDCPPSPDPKHSRPMCRISSRHHPAWPRPTRRPLTYPTSSRRRLTAIRPKWRRRNRPIRRWRHRCSRQQMNRRAATQRPVIPCQAMRRRRMGQGRANTGAGEGNRTLVCSLGGCRSTIELHPRRRPFRRFSPRMQLGPRLPQGANPMRPGRTACAISGSGPTGPRCQRAQGG